MYVKWFFLANFGQIARAHVNKPKDTIGSKQKQARTSKKTSREFKLRLAVF